MDEVSSSYMDYDRLKRVIYLIERDIFDDAESNVFYSYLEQCIIFVNNFCSNAEYLNSFKSENDVEMIDDKYSEEINTIPEVHNEEASFTANEVRKRRFLRVFNEEAMKSQKLLENLLLLLKKHLDILESYVSSLSANPFKTKNSAQHVELSKLRIDADYENELTHSALLFGVQFHNRARSDSEEINNRRQLKGDYFKNEDKKKLISNSPSFAPVAVVYRKSQLKIRELSLKRHITDLYTAITKLREFQLLNYTVSIKILKKYDKVLTPYKSDPIFSDQFKILKTNSTAICSDLNIISEDLVNIYANCFCKSNIEEALGKLKFCKGSGASERIPSLIFRIGIKYGVCVTLLAWIFVILNKYDDYDLFTLSNPDSYCFLLVGNFLVFRVLWIVNVLFFEHYKVNYVVLLEISESHVPKWTALFDENGTYWVGYFMFILLWLYANFKVISIPPAVFSVGIIFSTVAIIVHAFYKDREYGVLTNKRFLYTVLLTTPSYHVEFRDIIATDWFTSFNRILANLVYASFYIFSGGWLYSAEVARDMYTRNALALQVFTALVFIFPLLLRAMQVMRLIYDAELPACGSWKQYFHYPQSINLFKYTTSIVTVIVGTLVSSVKAAESQDTSSIWFYVPVFFYSIATIYQVYWDTVMDFGFLKRSQNYLLRDKLLYHDFKYFYYIVLCVNPLLRLIWCFSLLPEDLYNSTKASGYGFIILPFIELIRRSLWCIIRIEHEHVKSGESLCAFLKPTLSYDMADVVPLHFDSPNWKTIDITNKEFVTRRNMSVVVHVVIFSLMIILPFLFILL